VAINPEFIGRTYPPTQVYSVGREKIREFATALGDTASCYFEVDSARALGYPDLVAPPTFAIVVTMKAGEQVVFDPELALDYTRVVHGEQRFVHHRPIFAGDELTSTVSVDSIRSAAGNDMITVKAQVHSTSGELVSTVCSLLVSRGAKEVT
jgi:acyl dehydratase